MRIIKLKNDHYIIVDDSEIKEGDWMYNPEREPSLLQCIGKGSIRGWKKITHSTQPLESMNHGNYSSNVYLDIEKLSLQEVKELIGEVDIWQKFKEIDGSCQKGEYEHWLFESGYNQAIEDNKEKKYTEEDLKRAFFNGGNMKEIEEFNYFIKSLQPKTEWEVEFADGKLKLK